MRIDSPTACEDGPTGATPVGGASDTWSTSPLCCIALTSWCPRFKLLDKDGDGGGSGASGVAAGSSAVGDCALRLVELRRLAADLIEPASDLSVWLSVCDRADVDARGLSLLRIFERIDPRRERSDSFVSDREKDGYDCKESPGLELPLECD